MSPEEKLADLLNHYLKLAYETAGLNWDSDNYAEVEQMVELIVQIARAES